MTEINYPTKPVSKAENFQAFIVTDDYSIQRTRYMIHKAKRLGKIFESEWKDLLSENLYSELPGRMRIQKFLSDRAEGHTAIIQERIKNHFRELTPGLVSGAYLSLSFVSLWLIAVILRGAVRL